MPLVPVVVPAGPLPSAEQSRARFDALVAELHALRDTMNRAVHRCGTILIELSTPRMLAFGEVASLDELLERYDLPTKFSAIKYMTVAQHFTEQEARQLGVERSYAIIRGAAALPKPVTPRVLLAQNPSIRVGPQTMQLATAPLRALLGWVGGMKPESAPPAEVRRASKAADSLRDKLQRRFVAAGIGKSKMQVRRRGSAYVVRVELSMDEAAALLATVRKAP